MEIFNTHLKEFEAKIAAFQKEIDNLCSISIELEKQIPDKPDIAKHVTADIENISRCRPRDLTQSSLPGNTSKRKYLEGLYNKGAVTDDRISELGMQIEQSNRSLEALHDKDKLQNALYQEFQRNRKISFENLQRIVAQQENLLNELEARSRELNKKEAFFQETLSKEKKKNALLSDLASLRQKQIAWLKKEKEESLKKLKNKHEVEIRRLREEQKKSTEQASTGRRSCNPNKNLWK